jgi:TRAP-type C4-dicarboxylate transport system permease small subunit
LGSVVALRQDEHLALTEFSERYFPRAVPVLRRLCWLVIILCMVMFFIGSWHQTAANWSNFSQVTGLPSALFYLAGVVSALLMGAVAIGRFFDPTPFSQRQGHDA